MTDITEPTLRVGSAPPGLLAEPTQSMDLPPPIPEAELMAESPAQTSAHETKTSKQTYKKEDFDNPALLAQLLNEIAEDPSILDDPEKFPVEELARIEKLISPYGTVPESTKTDRWICLSYTNLRKDYLTKLLTTSFVGYLYRRCDEYGRQFKDTVDNMDDMAAAEKQVIANQARVRELSHEIVETIRERNALQETVEADTKTEADNHQRYNETKTSMTKDQILAMRDFATRLHSNQDALRLLNRKITQSEEELDAIQGFGKRFIIRQFLDEQFRFNPDKHVRSSYVSTAASAASAPGAPNANYASKFVPPDETFHNLEYYIASNYEELRGVAETLYRLKPDLDVGVLPYAEFTSEAAAQDFVDRNKDATIADILTLKYGKWNFVESFKANRDRIEAYRGTIVDDILQQVKDDTKIGAELVRDKATRRRVQNLRETGPAPKQVQEYMKQHGASDMQGVLNTEIKEADQERIFKEHQESKAKYECELLQNAENDPTPHDMQRVNVYTMSAGGRNIDETHFFTKAKAPETQMPIPMGQI